MNVGREAYREKGFGEGVDESKQNALYIYSQIWQRTN